MKKLSLTKGKFRKGALIAFGAMLVCCLTAAGAVNAAPAKAMTTANTVGVSEIYDSESKTFNTNLNSLYQRLGATDYSDLQTKIIGGVLTAADIAAKNGNKDVLVTLNGKKWTPTYLFSNANNEVILTLWYSDTETSSVFSNDWRSDNTLGSTAGYTKLSNHYGNSRIRALTLGNGGQYYSPVTAGNTSVSSDGEVRTVTAAAADVQASAFYEYAQGAISSYLVAPDEVEWQQDGHVAFTGLTGRLQNETLVKVTDNWYNANIQNSQDDPLYFQWGSDKVWLPSVSEVGFNVSELGLWKISTNQRTCMTDETWLRSGYLNSANGACILYNADFSIRNRNTTDSHGVRPAIHLNLTKAAASVSSGADDLINRENDRFNTNNLNELYKKLGATSYASLAASVQGGALDSGDIAKLNDCQGDVYVKFGGYDWTVTYLSTTSEGEVIATLWYADAVTSSAFSDGWRSGTTSGGNSGYTKHSNHYGGSSLRAITLGNGGSFYTGTGVGVQSDSNVTQTSATAEQAKASQFYKFAQGNLAQYLVAPSQVEWQKVQFNGDYSGGYRTQNDNLAEVTDNWFSENIANSQSDPLYYGWANDKVWLPSVYETGWDLDNTGIWATSQEQRKKGSSSCWLRSGHMSNAGTSEFLDASGNGGYAFNNASYGVRPAIHLNLTKASQNTTDSFFMDVGNELAARWNAAVEESLFNGGKQVTFTLTDNWYALPDNGYVTSFGEGTGFSCGGLYIPAGANIVLDLNGYIIDRNLATAVINGKVISTIGGTLTVNDGSAAETGKITGGFSSNDGGGGIHATGQNVLTINGGNVVYNKTTDGGGGAVFCENAVINGGVFANNSIAGSGGAFVILGTVEFNGGIICGNYSENLGGGIYIHTSSTNVVINDIDIYGNTASYTGGAIHLARASRLTVNGGKIRDNYSLNNAGAISMALDCQLVINGGEITGNKTENSGGAIYATSCTLTINDGLFENNLSGDKISTGSGGAISGTSFNLTVNGGTFKDNAGTRYGGAIYVGSGECTVNGGLFTGNSAVRGGAIDVVVGTLNVNGGLFTGNKAISATDSGAALYSHGTGVINMRGGVITGNLSSGNGAIYVGGTFNLYGGTVSGNTNTGNAKSNVYLADGKVITVKANLMNATVKTLVGVTMKSTGVFTSGYSANCSAAPTAVFFADNGKTPILSNKEVTIGTATATRSDLQWRYTTNGVTTNIPVSSYYQSVEYTGATYSVSLASGTVAQANDENGKPVSSFANAGKYYFTANGGASYNNGALTFEILPRDIGGAAVSVSDTLIYNGSAQTPEVTVELGGKILEKGKDYAVSYSNNVNAGSASVIVEGLGNYGGTASGNFTIEKRNVEIRWGDTVKNYTGSAQGVTAYVEGAVNGDGVSVSLYYEKNGKSVTPVNAGTYVAHAVVAAGANYKLAPNAKITEILTVNPKTVEAVWSGLNQTYDGTVKTPSATYTAVTGAKIKLAVTVSGTHTDAGTYTATATINDVNYVLSSASANARLVINKVGAELVWGNAVKVYDGNAFTPLATLNDLQGNSLAGGLTFEYFDGKGASLGSVAPVHVGKYTVRATLSDGNYALADGGGKIIDYSECAYEITAATASVTWTFADNTFDGTGKAPEFTFDVPAAAVNYSVTYAEDDGNGNPAGEYTSDKPVNAGKYLAKAVFDNGDYEQIIYPFTVEKKSAAVVWSGDGSSVMSGASSYKWLYDGKAHAPQAVASVTGVTVDGNAVTSLEISVSGLTAVGNHTATAVLKNTDLNKNFTLTNATQSYEIVRSEITAVEWYEYGSSVPLAAGAKPSYQYISVYGRQGPKLSAYGVATMTGTDGNGGTVTRTAKIPLTVSYSGNVNPNGYWSIDGYSATAALSGDAAANSAMTATDLTLEFSVTALRLETVKADVEWVFGGNALTDGTTGAKYWIYDGQPHAPEARRIPDGAAYDPADPSTYEVLAVGGAMTDAGVYYAYILPCNYDIDGKDADCLYEIRPRQITVSWAGVNGGTSASDFEWTYNGIAHAPTVSVTGGTDGLVCTLKPVTAYVNAGTYTAVAEAEGGNFVIYGAATQAFTIRQMTVNPADVVWAGVNGGTAADDFKFPYDGNAHAPTATLTLNINGTQVAISLTVTGETSALGAHTAYASLDTGDMANANFILSGAECRFSVEESAIRQIVWDNENADGSIEFTYDGATVFCPTAYYWDKNNQKVSLNVVGGRTEAGEYIAYVTDNTGLTAGMTHKFTIKPMELNVSWTATVAVYNGAENRPECAFTDGAGAAVTLVLGADYAVTGFTDAGEYTAEITFLNKNYTYAEGTQTAAFTVTPKKITVTWTANTDGTFDYEYNGAAQRPAFTSDESGVTVTVTGAETNVGSYTAVATVADGNYYLSDGTHADKAECGFRIVPFRITVQWKGEGGDPADFSWEYDGNAHAPEAYFTDWSGDTANPVRLSVRGEKTNAGTGYVAVAVAPENCEFRYSGAHANSGTRTFDITAKVITGIIWKGENGSTFDFIWEYDGTVKTPVAQTAEGDTLAVTGSATDAGVYMATAVLPNAGNYIFDASLDPTKEFTVAPKETAVKWYGENGSISDFSWDYTGSFICPTAKFEDVNGNLIDVPVNGGSAAAGQSVAEAVDVFANYAFAEATKTQPFTVEKKTLTVTWSDGDRLADGVYTYEYNGRSQMPLASSAEGVNLSYFIRNAAGEAVGAVINAGFYTVTVSPASMNHKIDAADATVRVEITPKTVAVQWGSLTLGYTGGAQAPKAWFTDANNQAVELEVTPAQSEAGTGYSVTADFKTATGNYVLDTATATQTFDIEKKTEETLIWDWTAGSWITSAP